jgi:hypothetical protein
MGSVSPHRAGLVLGALIGGWHLLWAVLVAVGWGQTILNFVFWMHFLKPPYTVGPFSAGIAAVLIVVTSVIGYLMGYILGLLWNWIHR